MILRVRRDRDVEVHRQWRRRSSLKRPVLAVGPDTRRVPNLLLDQLAAMGVDVASARGHRSSTSLERWWRAWTSASAVREVVLLNPQLAQPQALCDYLLRVEELGVDALLLERTRRRDGHEAVMSELHARLATQEPPLPAELQQGCATGRTPHPTVPRVGTFAFLEAVEATLPAVDAQRIRTHYFQTIQAARETLREGACASEFYEAARTICAGATSDDELLVRLHALRAAALATQIPVTYNPHRVLARAGRALASSSDARVWDRLATELDASCSAARSLVACGWATDEVMQLTLTSAADHMSSSWIPRPVKHAVAVLMAARREDGASDDDPLLLDPTAPTPITTATVARWARRAAGEQGASPVGHHLRRQRPSPEVRLSDLGMEWRGE